VRLRVTMKMQIGFDFAHVLSVVRLMVVGYKRYTNDPMGWDFFGGEA